MRRRGFLKSILAATGTSLAAAPTVLTAASKKRYRWRLVMAVPKTLPIWGTGVIAFAKKVKSISEGRLNIRVYGAGELVPALQTFETVRSGKVQMASSASYYWLGKIPAAVFFSSVPFGMDANAMRSWLAYGGGQELWDELYAPHGILALPGGNTGMQMGGWFRKEINSINDFKGLKMRIPGLGGRVIAKLGGKPILMPGGDIFTNLTTGVIDATEWVGPYHDYIMGFYKAAKYYYSPGWHEPGPSLELMINKESFVDLPKELQDVVTACAAEMDRNMYLEWIAKDAQYLDKIRKETKVTIKTFPEEVLKAFKKYGAEEQLAIAKTSPLSQKIYDSYTSYQRQFQAYQKQNAWTYIKALDR